MQIRYSNKTTGWKTASPIAQVCEDLKTFGHGYGSHWSYDKSKEIRRPRTKVEKSEANEKDILAYLKAQGLLK